METTVQTAKPFQYDDAKRLVEQMKAEGKPPVQIANEICNAGGVIGRKGQKLSEISVMMMAIGCYEKDRSKKKEAAATQKTDITVDQFFEMGKALMAEGMAKTEVTRHILKSHNVMTRHRHPMAASTLPSILRYGPKGAYQARKERETQDEPGEDRAIRRNLTLILNMEVTDGLKLQLIKALL